MMALWAMKQSDKHEGEEQKYGSMDERANMGARMGDGIMDALHSSNRTLTKNT